MVATVENTSAAWSGRASAPTSWEAAGWSERGQTERFLAVARHLDADPGDTLLDFGCGTGRLEQFLPYGVGYVGFDWASGMLERARRDHPARRFVDELAADDRFDHVVAVGTFNLPGSRWRTMVEIEKLWARARKSLTLSLYRGDDARCLRYGPDEIAWIVRHGGCRRFVIDGDYLDNDVMVVMRR